MQCVLEISLELERLITRKENILANMRVAHNPKRIAWLNMQLNDVNMKIREYHRRH